MAFTKITEDDLTGKGVTGLPDTPGLSTTNMQEKFDELSIDVMVPKHNGLIDELEDESAAASIGALDANGNASTVQAELNGIKQQGYTKAEADVLLAGKVDKETGKGLSENDFSNAYKDKLNNIEDNANNYVLPAGTQSTIGGVMGDGSTFTIDSNGVGHAIGGGGGGTADYDALINKPKINGTEVIGNKDSSAYGLLGPVITITSDAGSTVTLEKGTTVINAVQKTSTTWEAVPTDYGTWTVRSKLTGADDATTTVTVDAVKQYAVTVSHISATITVTYPAGATYCTLTKGSTVYTATSNPQAFTVRSLGTWTVEVSYNGVIKTATATISADGDTQSVTIEYASIVVTYGTQFEGSTITCTDGTSTYTQTAPVGGSTVTFTIPNTGSWVVSGVAGGATYQQTVVVSAYTSYATTLQVFNATITVTFPYSNGASCTITDGTTTLTATTSPMAFSIPNTGTWTATAVLDGVSKAGTAKTITTDGQTETDTIEYGTINLTYANEFRGQTITCAQTGGSTITKTAPSTGNTMSFYPDATGTWEITGAYSGTTYSSGNITVSSLSTAVSATLQTLATITVTIYGATEDTITFTDAASVSHTVVFATGQSSKSETLKVLPSGSSITFTSGVAKDPSNLSNDYTKTVTLTSASTEVYVMPDNAIYWYGYEGSDYSFSYVTGYNSADPSEQTNYIDASRTVSGNFDRPNLVRLTGEVDLTGFTTSKAIFGAAATGSYYVGQVLTATQINSISNSNYADVTTNPSAVVKDFFTSATYTQSTCEHKGYTATDPFLSEMTLSGNSGYIAVGASNGNASASDYERVYALWLE